VAETRVSLAPPSLRWVAGAALTVFAVATLFAVVSRIDTILFLTFFGIVLAAILSRSGP
jgi:hypothetical protein